MLPDDPDSDPVRVRQVDVPEVLPALPVSDAVIFPHMLVPLVVSDRKLILLAEDVLAGARLFAAFTQRPPELLEGSDELESIYRMISRSSSTRGTSVLPP